MGFIRGGLVAIIGAFLFIAFFVGGILLTISWSLNYDGVKDEFQSVVKDVLFEQIGIDEFFDDEFVLMQTNCQLNSEYVLNYREETVVIPCSVVAEGQDAIVDYWVVPFIDEVYFEPYDCEFFDCFSKYEIPFFLVSANSQDYFYSRLNYVLIGIAILSILGFFLAEKKSNFFLLISVLMIIASLPFAKFDIFFGFFGNTVEGLLSLFFNRSYSVFLSMLFLGGGLLLFGILLKIFKLGFNVSAIFTRSGKEEIKKEERKVARVENKKEVKKVVKKPLKKGKKK